MATADTNQTPGHTAKPDSIVTRFSAVAARFPDRIAVNAGSIQWTYAELEQRSNALAVRILDRVGSRAEPVALLMAHSAPLIAWILAVLKTGNLYLCLDSAQTAGRLASIMDDSGARLLIADDQHAALAQSLASEKVQIFEAEAKSKPFSRSGSPTITVPEEAGAWLMYTSGSTGIPKGVWQNHRNALLHSEVYADMIKVTSEDRLTLLTSCSLAASATHLFTSLLNGASLHLFHVRSLGVDRLAQWIARERITVYHSVPTVFRQLLRRFQDRQQLESLRLVRLGGEPVLGGDLDLYRQFCPPNCLLIHSLSSTESGLMSAWITNHDSAINGERVHVGRPVRGVEILLLDEHRRPVEPGMEGRIAVRSPHLAQGYWKQPDATREVFENSSSDSPNRVFLTSDLGRFRADGCLEHLGRTDQTVKIRGQQVHLEQVETALRATGLFEEAVAVARENPLGERRLAAYFVPRPGTTITPALCRQRLAGDLPEVSIPTDFVSLERMPQTLGGKIDRLSLPDLPRDVRPTVAQGPRPRDGVERKLALMWQEVLGLPSVGCEDDFFQLGGDSLRSTLILVRIEEAFNLVLSPSTLVEHSTIEKLARVVADQTLSRANGPLVSLREAENGRPLFLVHNGQGSVACFGQLARRLSPRPVYGLQSLGLSGECWPLMSIADMARRYLREVISKDPTGPYLLGGTCSGGMVAFEMAQQLVAAGRKVALVALFDVNHPLTRSQYGAWERMALSVRDAGRVLRWGAMRAAGIHRSPRWLPRWRRFIANMNRMAFLRYQPILYPGVLTLFLTIDKEIPREDYRLILRRLARESHTITIPGDRSRLFTPPNVDETARQLDRCIAASECELAP
jgi:amino acid adenylation domain-containing protein